MIIRSGRDGLILLCRFSDAQASLGNPLSSFSVFEAWARQHENQLSYLCGGEKLLKHLISKIDGTLGRVGFC